MIITYNEKEMLKSFFRSGANLNLAKKNDLTVFTSAKGKALKILNVSVSFWVMSNKVSV